MMKVTLIAVMIMASMAHAKQIWSPDKTARIEAEESIRLFDEKNRTSILLVPSTRGTSEIEVSWSPDSRKVVIAQDFARGSVIYGAWFDGENWHKTIQTEQDFVPIVRIVERLSHSTVDSESRNFAGWMGSSAVRVKGTLRLRDGKTVVYEYRLEFGAQAGRYDRGGYEEGVITSSEYKTL